MIGLRSLEVQSRRDEMCKQIHASFVAELHKSEMLTLRFGRAWQLSYLSVCEHIAPAGFRTLFRKLF